MVKYKGINRESIIMAIKKSNPLDSIISPGEARALERNLNEDKKEIAGDNSGTYLRSDLETGKRSKRP